MSGIGAKTSTEPNHKKDLLLLFSIPLAIIILAVGITYIPRLLANPGYDFLYYTCPDYTCSQTFSINSSGKINQTSNNTRFQSSEYLRPSELRYYDSQKDSTKIVSLDQAQTYNINNSSKAPDGYELSSEESGGGFLLYSDYSNGWYLKKGLLKKRIELSPADPYYSDQVKFLGWVEK